MKLVKYSAEWCGPCKSFAPVAKVVTQELGLEMVDVDIDREPAPGVMSVPTIRLVSDSGSVIAENVGALNARQLKEWIAQNTPRF